MAKDLLRKMLSFDPDARPTVKECLQHPYLADLHAEEDEPERTPCSGYEFDFEKEEINGKMLRDTLYEEILLHHFPDRLTQHNSAVEAYDATYGLLSEPLEHDRLYDYD
jgi:mitogen-activated protein kinase 1/3